VSLQLNATSGLTRNANIVNNQTKYSITNFIPVVEIQNPDGSVDVLPDYLNWSLTSLIKLLTDWKPVEYDGSIPFVTLVYYTYLTTSLDWLVLIYNGFMSALEIPPGSTICMPNQQQIDNYLQKLVSKTGKVVSL